jgi:hypothetical protein
MLACVVIGYVDPRLWEKEKFRKKKKGSIS